MADKFRVRPFSESDVEACLCLFDANCPEYFAPNERSDYQGFLSSAPPGYLVCEDHDSIVGAFGVAKKSSKTGSLQWILVDPASHGKGLGSAMMAHVVSVARQLALDEVAIAASHKSAPFFGRFGAEAGTVTPDGWGPGMDRVDMLMVVSDDHGS